METSVFYALLWNPIAADFEKKVFLYLLYLDENFFKTTCLVSCIYFWIPNFLIVENFSVGKSLVFSTVSYSRFAETGTAVGCNDSDR